MKGHTCKVLVVDDEPLVLEMLGTALREAGLEITEAGSSMVAMELLDAELFDAVVTDLHLTPFDGFEIGRFARERNKSASVVIITGRPSPLSEIQATDEGMSFLVKPVSLSMLIGHVCMRCAEGVLKKKWDSKPPRFPQILAGA